VYVFLLQPTMFNKYIYIYIYMCVCVCVFLFEQYLYYNHTYMFRYICIILREFQRFTFVKLCSVCIIKNYQIKIFMWLLLMKYSLYDFYNIICISNMFMWLYMQSGFPILMLPVCCGGEYYNII